jgi:hypothetical protein
VIRRACRVYALTCSRRRRMVLRTVVAAVVLMSVRVSVLL